MYNQVDDTRGFGVCQLFVESDPSFEGFVMQKDIKDWDLPRAFESIRFKRAQEFVDVLDKYISKLYFEV